MRSYLLLVLAAGCTATSSQHIATSDLFVNYELIAQTDHVTARATFHVGDGNTGTVVQLDGSDRISCGGVPLAQSESALGQITYQADIPMTASTFVFELARQTGNVSTSVTVPAAIAMHTPVAQSKLPAGQPVTVTWSPAGSTDRIDISLSVTAGACTSAIVGAGVPDTGSAVVPGAQLVSTDGNSCTGQLGVARSVQTELGAPFAGGEAVASAYDGALVTIQP
jgi:hypothetical protein